MPCFTETIQEPLVTLRQLQQKSVGVSASFIWIIVLFQEVLDISTVRNSEVMLGQKIISLHRIL